MSVDQILIVEDDASMAQLLVTHLTALGFETVVAGDGLEALEIASQRAFNLVLLDVTLPGLDGMEVCRRLRTGSAVPIILVTAADRPESKVLALEIGGDDYLTKPFHSGELVARIRAVLRRSKPGAVTTTVIQADDIKIDLAKRLVWRGSEELRLTKIEFDLLTELARNLGSVLSYEHLLGNVWGKGYEDVRLVHVHISNLRHKLERSPTDQRHIIAVPGIGYRFRLNQ